MAIIYGLKVNLSVAMVAMLNHTALAHESGHGTTPANGTISDAEPECQGSGSGETMEVIILHLFYHNKWEWRATRVAETPSPIDLRWLKQSALNSELDPIDSNWVSDTQPIELGTREEVEALSNQIQSDSNLGDWEIWRLQLWGREYLWHFLFIYIY